MLPECLFESMQHQKMASVRTFPLSLARRSARQGAHIYFEWRSPFVGASQPSGGLWSISLK